MFLSTGANPSQEIMMYPVIIILFSRVPMSENLQVDLGVLDILLIILFFLRFIFVFHSLNNKLTLPLLIIPDPWLRYLYNDLYL